jgi:uncharacterized coiled-coil protein SlyX
MAFHGDHDAMYARLPALDAQVASHERELASRDEALVAARTRIAELGHDVGELQRELADSQPSLRAARRDRGLGKVLTAKVVDLEGDPLRDIRLLSPTRWVTKAGVMHRSH